MVSKGEIDCLEYGDSVSSDHFRLGSAPRAFGDINRVLTKRAGGRHPTEGKRRDHGLAEGRSVRKRRDLQERLHCA